MFFEYISANTEDNRNVSNLTYYHRQQMTKTCHTAMLGKSLLRRHGINRVIDKQQQKRTASIFSLDQKLRNTVHTPKAIKQKSLNMRILNIERN